MYILNTGTKGTNLKISNRNFNVFRDCFELWSICLFEAGVENPVRPTNCIDLSSLNVNLEPNDNSELANILDNNENTKWDNPTLAEGTFLTGSGIGSYGIDPSCWKPYDQWIIIPLETLFTDDSVSGFSSIGYDLSIYSVCSLCEIAICIFCM